MSALLDSRRVVWVVFAGAALASAAVILIAARGTTFTFDEWGILFRLAHSSLPVAIFEPPAGKYLIAVPTLIYGALAEVFGAHSYLPYRLLGIALIVLAAGLFLALAKRRVGAALALPGSILLLFLGAAGEVVAVPGRVPSQVAICAGLATLLTLERRDRRGDLVACGFATLAVVSHPIGLAFVVAAAVIVCFGRPGGWRASWVFLVPVAVYGLWSLTLSKPANEDFPVTLGDTISFAWQGFVALWATMTGLFRLPWNDAPAFTGAPSKAVAIIATAALALIVLRARRISVGLAAMVAALAFDLIAPTRAPGGVGFLARTPDMGRYIYPGAILLLLLIVEVIGLRKLPARTAAVLGSLAVAAFALAMVSNVTQLVRSGDAYGKGSGTIEAELGAFDLARGGRDPAVLARQLEVGFDESSGYLSLIPGLVGPDAADELAKAAPAYLEISDSFGGPASSAATIRAAPLPTRQQADRALIATLPARFEPRAGGAPRLHGCRRIAPTPAGSIAASVPPGTVRIDAIPGTSTSVILGRLAGAPVQPLAWPAPARSGAIALPAAGLGQLPWQLAVGGARGLTYCPDSSPPGGGPAAR